LVMQKSTTGTLTAFEVVNRGTGHSFYIHDQTATDTSAFIVNNAGDVGIGVNSGQMGSPSWKTRIEINDGRGALLLNRAGGTTSALRVSVSGSGNLLEVSNSDTSLTETFKINAALRADFTTNSQAATNPNTLNNTVYNKELIVLINGVEHRLPMRQV